LPALTRDEVLKVASLSRLALNEAEVAQYGEQLSQVLGYVAKLQELDVSGIEPMAHATELVNVLRDDVERPGLSVDRALMNAPAADPPFFRVPKVLGEGSA
jgi:aspartyl-tRNA(Asn)/glutamyl-tRNA(Gln) amidotransferase subunit C